MSSWFRWAAAACVVSALATSGCRSNEYRASLATGDEVAFVRAIKGNDLVVQKGSELARVRLVGVYAFDPKALEKKDISVWASGAVAAVGSHVAGKPLRVTLLRPELDPRGRHLGFLSVEGADLGRTLVSEGHMAVYTEYPFQREPDYLQVEGEARASGRGLWGGAAAAKRLQALRETWASVRARESGAPVSDPLLGGEGGR